MAHKEQHDFIKTVKQKYPDYFKNKKVLEIGSLDINGSVRQFFENCDYLGIDLAKGKGVDIVCEGHKFNEDDNIFDVVISCECFEHNPYWMETFYNMIRLTKPNGLIIMTCATIGRKEHGTVRSEPESSPLTVMKGWDYYKNLTEDDFKNNFQLSSIFDSFEFSINSVVFDLYFIGIKK